MSKQTIELLRDPNMYLFIERAIRGGMSIIGYRYAEANNKYMESFDPTKESSYLMYFDANSLYSWAMRNPLTVGKFKWVEIKKKFKFMKKILKEKKYNFLVECNIRYPEGLHDHHNDYPLAPEKIVIDDNFKESPYCKSIRNKFKKRI